MLAPHYSRLSIAGYRDQLEEALGGRARLAFVESWHAEPGFVDLLAGRVRGTRAHVVFTAHSFSYQSESATGEPWLGPDILDHLAALHGRGVTDVLVCPVGFVADHLEIRWDLDVEARETAQELGMHLERIEMPNDDPAFVATLATLVKRALAVPSTA